MSKKLKLIWDFMGEDAQGTAKHHCIHLKEFAENEELSYLEVNHTVLSDMHCIAFVTVDEQDMPIFRDALKPHRGQLA